MVVSLRFLPRRMCLRVALGKVDSYLFSRPADYRSQAGWDSSEVPAALDCEDGSRVSLASGDWEAF